MYFKNIAVICFSLLLPVEDPPDVVVVLGSFCLVVSV